MIGIVQSGGTPDATPPVEGGQIVPLEGFRVTLHLATDETTQPVGSAVSDGDGRFSISTSSAEEGLYYVVAESWSGRAMPVRFLALLGPTLPESIVVNELTTVAGVYAAAQILDGDKISGSGAALRAAAAMARNLVSVSTGQPSPVMTSSPNADETNSLRSLRSLANLLAPVIRQPRNPDPLLFELATPPGGGQPADTLEAIHAIALNPANNVGKLFAQSTALEVFRPALRQRPDAWTLVVKVNDSGDDQILFGGPANVVFDRHGRGWIANNVVQGEAVSSTYCMVLDADGTPARDGDGKLLSPFTGMELIGAGFGIALDAEERVWIGDFGWGGENPGGDAQAGGVSVFTPDAEPVRSSMLQGGVYRVQQVVVDRDGNVWNASWGGHQVVVYPGGDDGRAVSWPAHQDLHSPFQPFGIALASDGRAWVTNSNGNTVSRFRFDGTGLTREIEVPVGKTVKGVAIDDAGYVWVGSGGDDTVYRLDGETGEVCGAYRGGGLDGPWGVTLDGDGNLWAGNFGPLRLGSVFTGRLSCLAGSSAETPGAPLTPPTGYTVPSAGDPVLLADGNPLYGEGKPPCYTPLTRTTGLNIDAAGNVWVTNNWKPDFTSNLFGEPELHGIPDPADGNPGGEAILIFVGLAKPRADVSG